MRIVLDTNILVQALLSSKGASNYILQCVLKRKLELALSTAVFHEYEDVLSRAYLLNKMDYLSEKQVLKLLATLRMIAYHQLIYYQLRPNLKDEKDNLFVELAFASQVSYLVTSNVRDFKNSDLKIDNFIVISPANFVKEWRKSHE